MEVKQTHQLKLLEEEGYLDKFKMIMLKLLKENKLINILHSNQKKEWAN